MLIISWTRHPWNLRKRGHLSVSQQVLKIRQPPHTSASCRKDLKRPDLTWSHKTSLKIRFPSPEKSVHLRQNWREYMREKKGSADIISTPPCLLWGKVCGGADAISSFRRQLLTTSSCTWSLVWHVKMHNITSFCHYSHKSAVCHPNETGELAIHNNLN